MNCPVCFRREITTINLRRGKDFREYDKVIYECAKGDARIVTETPINSKVKLIKKP